VNFAELTALYVEHLNGADDPAAQQRRLAEYTARFYSAVGDASYGAPDDKVVDVKRSRTAEGGIVSVHRDVTLQRRTTTALSASDALFRDAMESLGEGLTIWDSEDRLVLWNRRFLELTPQMEPHLRAGATFAELYATLIDAQAPELSQEARAQRIEKRLAARGKSTTSFSLNGPNGMTLEVTDRRTSSGGIVSVYRDVTQTREFQRAIIESEARFRDGIESMGEGFVLWDAQDRLVAWNKHAEILLPWQSRLHRRGLHFSAIVEFLQSLTSDQSDPAAWAAHLAQRRGRRDCLGETISFVAGSGRRIELVDRATSDGGIVSIYRDVTEAHQLLERLQASESELQRALVAEREMNAEQRRFISIASHEFRTPLAIIDSTAQRIQARMVDADEHNADMLERMDRIRGSVSRMTDIIDRTLTTARLDEGRFDFEPASLDLGKLLQDVVARQRSIVPSFAIEIVLPATDTIVTADAKLLELVFTNIISNAVKYSGKSRRIEVTVASGDESVTIEMRDHGIGVPQDELDKLFTRFYRASTAQGITGTGIGLHLANELVQMHGGRIEIHSELGRGLRVVVQLPRDAARRDSAA